MGKFSYKSFRGASTAFLTLALVSSVFAQAPSNRFPGIPAILTVTETKANAVVNFEYQWSLIESYIHSNALSPDATVIANLKEETRVGIYDWSCTGSQLGWDCLNQTVATCLTFVSPETAAYAANQILDLADAMAAESNTRAH